MLSVIMLYVANNPFMLSVIRLAVANNLFMLSGIMLNVAKNPFMLSVVMLNVILLSVVAPAANWRQKCAEKNHLLMVREGVSVKV